MYTGLLAGNDTMIRQETLILKSLPLERGVTYTLLFPDDDERGEPLNLLLLNDGQEIAALQLKETLEKLYNNDQLKPVLVVAVHAGESRLHDYGTAGVPDFKARGNKAAAYTSFIIEELLPEIKTQFNKSFEEIAFAGFSLGGLSALDICWNHPEIFNRAGVFSGSFWWRSKALDKGYTDNDRIMHRIVRESKNKPKLKFWLQTGTLDEVADRNRNGIIDSLDDTTDLIFELEQKGYNRPDDIKYTEMVGGRHDTATWAKAMPGFLLWAFGK